MKLDLCQFAGFRGDSQSPAWGGDGPPAPPPAPKIVAHSEALMVYKGGETIELICRPDALSEARSELNAFSFT